MKLKIHYLLQFFVLDENFYFFFNAKICMRSISFNERLMVLYEKKEKINGIMVVVDCTIGISD